MGNDVDLWKIGKINGNWPKYWKNGLKMWELTQRFWEMPKNILEMA